MPDIPRSPPDRARDDGETVERVEADAERFRTSAAGKRPDGKTVWVLILTAVSLTGQNFWRDFVQLGDVAERLDLPYELVSLLAFAFGCIFWYCVPAVLAMRAADQNWADSVAGDMERHYSPGRTWEALARTALPLLSPGDVLDIASGDGVLAELLAPHAHRYVCIDSSQRVVAAASERLRRFANVDVREGDMHALPFKDGSFDLVVLMHALTYADKPAQAVAEAARVLRKGGRLLLSSLAKHEHRNAVEAYGHQNLGFSEKELRKFADKAGLTIASSETVTREKRPPHFEVISLIGIKP